MHDNRAHIAATFRASGEKLYYRNRRFANPADDGCTLSARDSEAGDNGTCAKGVTKAPPAPPPATGDAEPVEVWRPTHISPHYEVSNLGRIRSWRPTGGSAHGGVARAAEPRYLKGYAQRYGHVIVTICQPGGEKVQEHVHKLVARAFIGECPEGLEVCHFNGRADDNRLDNLGYTTRHENQMDRRWHEAHGHGKERPGARARAVTAEGMGHTAITAIPCSEDAVGGVASASSRATPRKTGEVAV